MSILVWGFGEYYHKKENSIPEDAITAYISTRETGQFRGINIIKPQEIGLYQYNKLYIMVGPEAFFEILEELNRMEYQEWDKIVLGWNLEPYTEDEELVHVEGNFQISSEGVCIYYGLTETIELKNSKEWERLKQHEVRKRKKNSLMEIPLWPISDVFGFDRGQPIDRYYIETFLSENSSFIQGTVLEVADREYTIKYGKNVKQSITTHVTHNDDSSSRLLNLETGEGVETGVADCFILTQTLPFIFDVRAAAANVIRLLKNDGVALVTVSGISQISRYDMDRWGHYWSFTSASLRKLFEDCRDVEYVKIKTYGNVKTAVAGLYGLAVEDMVQGDIMYQDDDYQQIIAAVVRKKGNILSQKSVQ